MNWLLHNPIADMPGPDFIRIYAALSVGVVAFAGLTLVTRFWTRATAGRTVTAIPTELDPYEIAWLRDGEAEVIRLATIRLIHRNYLQFINGQIERATPGPDPRHLAPVESAVFRFIGQPKHPSEICTDPHLLADIGRHCQSITDRCKEEQWIISTRQRAFWRRCLAGLLALLFLLALYKLFVAAAKGRTNVGFLVALLAVNVVLFAFIRRAAGFVRLSQRGLKYLSKVKSALHQLQSRASTITPNSSDNTVALLAGAFGLGALQDSIYAPFATALRPPKSRLAGFDGSSGGWSSGCGSGCSSSSSSSCGGGGGCGGGGCGGCGS